MGTRKVVLLRGGAWEDAGDKRYSALSYVQVGILTYGEALDADTFEAHCELGGLGVIMIEGRVYYVVHDEASAMLWRVFSAQATLHMASVEVIWTRGKDGDEPPIG